MCKMIRPMYSRDTSDKCLKKKLGTALWPARSEFTCDWNCACRFWYIHVNRIMDGHAALSVTAGCKKFYYSVEIHTPQLGNGVHIIMFKPKSHCMSRTYVSVQTKKSTI